MKQKSNLTSLKNIILSVIFILAVALDCWGVYIRMYGKDKVQSYIFKVGSQKASAIDPVTGEETTEERWFCEVNIYDNCYEILFNYFIDDTHSEFYSQGLQFYLPDAYKTTDFSYYLNKNYEYTGVPVGPQHTKKPVTTPNKRELNFYFDKQNKNPIKINGVNKVVTDVKKDKFLGVTIGKETTNTSYFYNILSNKDYLRLDVSNFASANNYEDTIYSANPLNENSFFRIQLNEDGETKPFLMKMKGSNYEYLSSKENFFLTENCELINEDANFLKTYFTYDYENVSYYRNCDPYYLAEVIYNSCESLDYSSDGIVINFEFGDLFDYYYDTKEIINDQNINNKVKNYITNYYQIKVNKFKGNMTSASQSLFKTFNGSHNYNEELAGDAEDSEVFTDYHHGRSILELNEDYFDVKLESIINGDFIINGGTNNVIQSGSVNYKIYLELKEDFKKIYSSANGYRLRIRISLDEIMFENATFAGFVDGTFDGYTVYKITTYSVASGELFEEDITWEVINDA